MATNKITNSYFRTLFLILNLVFFTFLSPCVSCGSGSPYTTPRPLKPSPSSGSYGGTTPGTGGSCGGTTPGTGGSSGGSTPGTGGSSGGTTPGTGGSSGGSTPGTGGSSGGATPGTGGSSNSTSCPIDALQLGVCANLLSGVLNLTIGTPPVTPCCSLLQGLVDAEVAVCLCTAIRANILGLNLNIPLSLSLLVNYCGSQIPRGFQCP